MSALRSPSAAGERLAPPLALDPRVRRYDGGRVLVSPDGRVVRLTAAGAGSLESLLAGTASAGGRALARRLVDAGIAHPRPAPVTEVDVTVVVPVRDRPAELERCLAALEHPALVVDDGSRDGAAIAAVVERRGARLLRRAPAGPGAARNAALARVETALVAFLDSDCVAPRGWVRALAGHFDDPRVVAVAPRVDDPALDMGAREGDVAPGTRVSYVPSAALVMRREALGAGFDERLRYGEDVDLVWRLRDRGWRIRYDPRVVVAHGAASRSLALRRFHYGTSAAPLAQRHPGRLAPVVIAPVPGAVLALLAARRPLAAALVAAGQSAVLARRLRRVGVPARLAPVFTARAVVGTAVGLARAVEHPTYLAGVVAGAVRLRTLAPLTPRWSRGA